MADNNEQARKEGTAEQGIRFLRNIHIAIGAVALLGAAVFPAIGILPTVAAYEGVNAAAHEGLRHAVRRRPSHKPQLA